MVMQLSPSLSFLPSGSDREHRLDQAAAAALEAQILRVGGHRDADRIYKEALEAAWNQYAQVKKLDAASTQQGFYGLRSLEHVFADVLKEEYPPLNAFRLFTLDTSVPAGAQYHTLKRRYRVGEVQETSGAAGEQITARVTVQQAEERAGVVHYVTSVLYSIFEQLTDNYANEGKIRDELLAARDMLMEHANYRTWHGNPASGIYGVLNYPWLQKVVLSDVFSSASDADEVAQLILSLMDLPHELTQTVYKPNAIAVSPRLRNLLYRLRIPDGTMTVGNWITENNARGIKIIEEAHELQGVGPGGSDGILVYRKDRLGIMNVLVNPFSRVPVQQHALTFYNYFYMSHGGVRMPNVAGNLLAWVQVNSVVNFAAAAA